MAKNLKKRKPRGKSFSKYNQPPAAAKRVKKKKTILREKVGLQSWEAIQEYLTGPGASKFVKSIKSLTGRQYTSTYLDAAEYFKPKLARTEHSGIDGKALNLLPESITNLTFDQLLQLANAGKNETDK